MIPDNVNLSKVEIATIFAELSIIKNNLEFMYRSVELEEKLYIEKKLIIIRKLLGQ